MEETLSRKMRRHASILGLLGPAMLLVGFLVMVSLVMLAVYSVTPKGEFGFANYAKALLDPFYRGIILRTIGIGLTVAAILTVLSYPVAYYLARNKSPYKVLILALVLSPMMTNLMVRTVAWMQILGGAGIINRFLTALSVIDAPIEFLGTTRAIIPALVYNFFPYMILPLKAAIEGVDERLEEAAYSLGASRLYTFFRVVTPQTLVGLFAGFSLVFLRTISAFVTPKALGQGKFFVLSTLIYQQMHSLNWGLAAALSFLLLAGILCLVGLTRRLQRGTAGIYLRSRIAALVALFPEPKARRRAAASPREGRRGEAGTAPRKWKSPLLVDTKLVRIMVIFGIAFLVLPLLLLIRSAFSNSELMGVNEGFTLRWIIAAVSDPAYLKAALMSLKLGLCSVLISLVIGTMAVFGLRRLLGGKHPLFGFFNWALLSPLTIPAIVLAVGMVLLFQATGLPFNFNRLVLVHVLITLPYIVNNVGAAINNLDVSQEEAAFVLGAGRLRILWSIILPALKTGLVSAFIMAFIVSFDEVTATMLTSGTGQLTLPVKIMTDLDIVWSPKIAAVSLVLICFSLLILYIVNRVIGLEKLK
ncbi:MAG: ABC transporter permease subunit [Bacillota bacterium]